MYQTKKIAYIFDIDGTTLKTTIYTPILYYLFKERKYITILVLYILSPFIFILDKISRPLHQLIFYKTFTKILTIVKEDESFIKHLEKKIVHIIDKTLKNINLTKNTLFFISTNCSVNNKFLKARYNPTRIYTINLDNNINLTKLSNFKAVVIKEIINNNKDYKLIGYGDSKQDNQFLKHCDEKYLVKNNMLIKI